MMCRLIGAVVLLVALNSASAWAMPRFDVFGYCNRSVGTVGDAAALRASCVTDERTSYARLRSDWQRLPLTIRRSCVQSAAILGGSYVALAGCVDQQLRLGRAGRGPALN